MKNLKLALTLLLAAQFYSCSSTAVDKGFEVKKSAFYLTQDQIKSQEVPPPPAPGSPQYLEDFRTLHDWQSKRSPEQCAAANAEARATFEQIFSEKKIFREPLPAEVSGFFRHLKEDGDVTVKFFKDKYAKKRPFHTDKTLDPCLGRIGGLAYPSGHATISRLYALALSEILPGRREEFIEEADKAALYRVIGGVHHPTDIEAGKKLAESVFREFMKNPEFKAGLENLKNRLAK